MLRRKRNIFWGDTYVIYFIDTDQYDRNPEHGKELKEISRYCENNGFDLVWFCHDVEEVFLGYTVSDSQKVKEAAKFRRKKKIEEIQRKKLMCNTPKACVSNILNILDKYLTKK